MPYDDCCTVFVPQHPKTRPNIDQVHEAEKNIDCQKLLDESLKDVETINITEI